MNNEWIEWKVGECPVDGDVLVDAVYCDGERIDKMKAKNGAWVDIVRYRLYCPVFDSGWIKSTRDGEIPEECKGRSFDIKDKDSNRIWAEKYRSDNFFKQWWAETVGWYRLIPQDPYKEWVKIQEGCVMPDINTDIVAFHGGIQLMYKYFGPEIDSRMKYATHWRYPHYNPEE